MGLIHAQVLRCARCADSGDNDGTVAAFVCVCVFWGGGKRRCEHASIDWLTADIRILITAVSSCDEILEDRRHGGKGDGTHGRLVGATRGVVRGHGGP